jgi:hypothetical protein
MRVFENKVLRRIFRSKEEELTAGYKKLHNEKLHNLYYSLNIIRVIKSRRLKETYFGKTRNAYKTLTRKPEGKRSLGIPKCGWKVTIKMGLAVTGHKCVDWI